MRAKPYPNIPATSASSASVSAQPAAPTFAVICSGLVAPAITDATAFCRSSHEKGEFQNRVTVRLGEGDQLFDDLPASRQSVGRRSGALPSRVFSGGG